MGTLDALRQEQMENALKTITQKAVIASMRQEAETLQRQIAQSGGLGSKSLQDEANALIEKYNRSYETQSSDFLPPSSDVPMPSSQKEQPSHDPQHLGGDGNVPGMIDAQSSKEKSSDTMHGYDIFLKDLRRYKNISKCIKKLPDQETFLPKLYAMAQYLGLNPFHVLAKFYNESSINPRAKNTSPGQTASGLAQITQGTFTELSQTSKENADLPASLMALITIDPSTSFEEYQNMSATQQLDRRFIYIKKVLKSVGLQRITDPAVLYVCGFGVGYVQHAIHQGAIDPNTGEVRNPSFNIFDGRPNAQKLAKLNGSKTGELTLRDIGERIRNALS
ncbi:MAG: hypothetical protein NZL83_04200 [Candidatus Absconditabacterales bacterium]|nr:hypothetical protein [Candidatus Absconditabacterales bacterium]